jgi:hypothetical protein
MKPVAVRFLRSSQQATDAVNKTAVDRQPARAIAADPAPIARGRTARLEVADRRAQRGTSSPDIGGSLIHESSRFATTPHTGPCGSSVRNTLWKIKFPDEVGTPGLGIRRRVWW